jgi:hypothetical protein
LGVNTGTAGAFVVNGGVLGTPSSGTVTNLTGTASININGTVGATTANTGVFTTARATTSVGIGSVAPTATNFYNNKTITGSTISYANRTDATIQSDVTSVARIYSSSVTTAASAFTLNNLTHFWAVSGGVGAGSAITNLYGFYSGGSLVDATTNYQFYAEDTSAVASAKTAYGYYSAVNTATGGGTAYAFYAQGTAQSVFNGNVGIGKTPSTALDVNGTVTATTFSGAGTSLTGTASSLSIGGTAANATNVGITNDVATAVAVYPTWVTSNTGNLPQKVSSTKLSFIPSTGILSVTGLSLTNALNAISGGTGFGSYAVGDILYASTTTALSKLTLGTTNYVLTAGASAPQYVAQSTLSVGTATTATNLAGGAASQIPYQTGAGATSFLANGTAGQVLTSAGAGTPVWSGLDGGTF